MEGVPRSVLLLLLPLPWTGGDGDTSCLMNQAGDGALLTNPPLYLFVLFTQGVCSCYGTNRNRCYGVYAYGGGESGGLGLAVTRQRFPPCGQIGLQFGKDRSNTSSLLPPSPLWWHLSGMSSEAPDAERFFFSLLML